MQTRQRHRFSDFAPTAALHDGRHAVGFVLALFVLVGGAARATSVDVEARHDRPGPVEFDLEALDFNGTTVFSQTLTWAADDNSFSSMNASLPDSSSLLRITFTNDSYSPGGPDLDRNGYLDFLIVDTQPREAEVWDRTDGTDASFPGCGATSVDGRTVADCGNANDWVEYGLDDPPGTTLINHGFTLAPGAGSCPTAPAPSAWLFRMAEALRSRMGGLGDCSMLPVPTTGPTILEYDPCTGDWLTNCGSEDPSKPVILVFNWIRESDGANEGGVFGYTEAAGEAMYAALRDSSLPGLLADTDLVAPERGVHFIGHSRGTVVNSECVERLAAAGLTVDQVTTLDPHPVDGSPPPDWGDPEPRVWTNTVWSDNYWRADINPADFDGQMISGSFNTNLDCVLSNGDPAIEHSEVHAWYHGTVDTAATSDGAGTMIDPAWYDDDGAGETQCSVIPKRDATGYYFGVGVGAARRPDHPNQAGHLAPAVTARLVWNGDFEQINPALPHVGHAGWRYHGGTMTGPIEPWPFEGNGNHYLELGPGKVALEHNRMYLDGQVERVRVRLRRGALSPATDDRLELYLYPPATPGAEQVIASISVAGLKPGWGHYEFAIDAGSKGTTRTLGVRIADPNGLLIEGIADVDDIELRLGGDAPPVPLLGPLGLALLAGSLAMAAGSAQKRGGRGDRRSTRTASHS